MSTEPNPILDAIEKAKAEATLNAPAESNPFIVPSEPVITAPDPAPVNKTPLTPEPMPEPVLTEKQKHFAAAVAILRENNMRESDIPYNSPYWDHMNQYRRL